MGMAMMAIRPALRAKSGFELVTKARLRFSPPEYFLNVWGFYPGHKEESQVSGVIDDTGGEAIRLAIVQGAVKVPGEITGMDITLNVANGEIQGKVEYIDKQNQPQVFILEKTKL